MCRHPNSIIDALLRQSQGARAGLYMPHNLQLARQGIDTLD